MTKAVKRKHRRLKRNVRKTLGALFMASAILVAAIPAEGLQAGSADVAAADVKVDINDCNIPVMASDETIYTTGDGKYQFAYVSPKNASTNNRVAVILGYNGGFLEGNSLTIPDTVDAYLKYSDNQGTSSGYAAVGKSKKFLFYKENEPVYDEKGEPIYDYKEVVNSQGKPVEDPETGEPMLEKVQRTEPRYYPCYYEDRDRWEHLKLDEFYYVPNGDEKNVSSGDASAFKLTTLSEVQRIQGAEVWYIGNQYIEAEKKDGVPTGYWSIGGMITEPSQGIFSGQGNIRYLTVGDKLSGIGDYAFYGCSGMESIKLGNGLDTIGNSAFENCINMKVVDIDLYSRVAIIGARAFYNCQALQEFGVPISVTAIGDSAFEGCYAMKRIELCGEGANVSLEKIGPKAFKNCEYLESITFPRTFTNKLASEANPTPIHVNMFEGCSSLKYISVSNNVIEFTAKDETGDGLSFEEFKNSMIDEFYFEGLENSPVHIMCKDHNFAFSYYGKDLYEKTEVDENGYEAIYQVNSSEQLVKAEIDPNITDVKMPETIGPYKILEIDSTTFQNKDNLKKITIPSSIKTIAPGAFKGCYNLKDVIFTEPVNVSSIGTDAFKTQDVSMYAEADRPNLDGVIPELRFVGTVSYDCEAFQYAMDPSSNINYGTQVETYIKYYSGWPTNLVVQYNPDTDKNELVDYPTFADLSTGKYTTDEYAYMTDEYEKAATEAFSKYPNTNDMTENEMDIINAALNIELPAGIESIQAGLFLRKELDERSVVDKSITAYSLTEVAGGEVIEAGTIIADGEIIKAGTKLEAGTAIKDSEGNTEVLAEDTIFGVDKVVAQEITINEDQIVGGAFNGCKNLVSVELKDGTTTIGDYAFANCGEKLSNVMLPPTVTEIGKRPFTGCSTLDNVDFQGSDNFTCDNAIIYGLDGNGNKKRIVEFLEGRLTGVVEGSEVEGVSEIAEEAFMSTKVSSVDLLKSAITDVPEYAFAETPSLFQVHLPATCKSISANSFKDSGIQYMTVPGSVSYLDNDAFSGSTVKSGLTFYCEDDSNAKIYADKHGINTTSKPIELYYTVKFWDHDATLLDTQTVAAGMDAVPPTTPKREGYIFDKWVPDYHNIQSDMQITAQYKAEDPDAKKYTVKFVDWDETVLKTTLVLPGGDAEAPVDPKRDGYTFTGWRPTVTNIQGNTTIYAQYEKKDSSASQFTVRFIDHDDTVLYTQKVNPGEDAIPPLAPTREGYTFTGWRPGLTAIMKDTDVYAQYEKGTGVGGNGTGTDGTGNGGTNGNGGANATGSSNGVTTKLYTLTVRNGSGSGSYGAGTQPIIIADDPASGMEFDYWSISPTDTKIASKVLTATVVTMPAGDVTVTAHYKKKTGGSYVSGSGNSTNRPNNSGTINSGGTTVVIDKNGLSNTGVVSATVNGSSDNFTIKISESEAAAEAAIRALMAEYGDISNIKYFPMDISLYDESGKKKITDTTGLSIKITLPLPDSLITYAGNNKVAGIVNDRLDKLNAKFTTISGVSCITFTAEHFSPYVIYVDTGDLTAGSVEDSTPKTGDGIHPKWFLSIGLACISIVLFMKRDRRVMQKVRA